MRKLFPLFLFALILIGCGPKIPISEYPVEIQREFNTSFLKAWDAVLKVIEMSNAKLITSDKSGGIIVYRIFSNEPQSQRLFVNVYIKEKISTNAVLIYMIPKGSYMKEIDRDFFEKLKKVIEGN